MTIPGGQVTIEEKVLTVPEFQIGKYPVTNAQYAKFVEAGGYSEQKWWTEAGWEYRQSEKWTEPRYWNDKQWNGADYPVVGVSWYEAVAFCNWLNAQINPSPGPSPTGTHTSSKHQGGEQKWIMLPTEAQWQRAAQGDDGRVYPWGDEWDCQKCNNSVKLCNSNQTTPVHQYTDMGTSPFGVTDLAGNVWEWCLSVYENATYKNDNIRYHALRGGSWFDSLNYDFRSDFRNGNNPLSRFDFVGFRLTYSE